MDSLHTGCKERVLILVENDIFCLYIKGVASDPKLFVQTDEVEHMATYKVECREKIEVVIDDAPSEACTEATYYYKPMFYEQRGYQIIIENKGHQEVVFDHDQPNLREQVTYLGRDKKIMSGVLNFRNEIGYTDLRIKVDGQVYLTLTLEVYPSKISYKSDYKMLLQDINKEVYNLSFDFLRATYALGEVDQYTQPSLTEFYSLFKQKFEQLMNVLHIILECPHHELGMSTYIGKPKSKYLGNNQSLNYLRNHPQYVNQQEGRFIPTKALHVVKEVNYNTKENQLVKYWVKKILDKVERIRYYYTQLQREQDQMMLQELTTYMKCMKGVLRVPMFAGVTDVQEMPRFSLVLQRTPGYREVYKLYMLLMRSLSLIEGQYQISTKNVAELYEYWCFIKLGALLRDKYQLVSQDLIKVNHKGIFVVLKKGEASELCFKNPITKEKFSLKYNARGEALPTVNQKPDNILELKKEMAQVTYKYIFDAKYKVNYVGQAGSYYARPMEQDINTMHRYRDAIVYSSDQAHYERSVFGAFVLFPGAEESLYEADDFYQSIQKVGIGGFPFLPSTTTLLSEFLEQLVEASGHSHYEELPMQQGRVKYLQDMQIEDRNVLVAPTKNLEQIVGIKAHNIYHVPLKNVRKRFMQVQYVAIYEKKDSDWQGGIRYYGKVKQVEIRQRKQLVQYFPKHGGNLEEDYVVYRLEALIPLERPIVANGYGIPLRMYTNKGLLDYATTIPELSIQTQAEFQLYLTIKRLSQGYEGIENEETKQYVAKVGTQKFYIEGDQLVCQTPDGSQKIDLKKFFRNPGKLLKWLKGNR